MYSLDQVNNSSLVFHFANYNENATKLVDATSGPIKHHGNQSISNNRQSNSATTTATRARMANRQHASYLDDVKANTTVRSLHARPTRLSYVDRDELMRYNESQQQGLLNASRPVYFNSSDCLNNIVSIRDYAERPAISFKSMKMPINSSSTSMAAKSSIAQKQVSNVSSSVSSSSSSGFISGTCSVKSSADSTPKEENKLGKTVTFMNDNQTDLKGARQTTTHNNQVVTSSSSSSSMHLDATTTTTTTPTTPTHPHHLQMHQRTNSWSKVKLNQQTDMVSHNYNGIMNGSKPQQQQQRHYLVKGGTGPNGPGMNSDGTGYDDDDEYDDEEDDVYGDEHNNDLDADDGLLDCDLDDEDDDIFEEGPPTRNIHHQNGAAAAAALANTTFFPSTNAANYYNNYNQPAYFYTNTPDSSITTTTSSSNSSSISSPNAVKPTTNINNNNAFHTPQLPQRYHGAPFLPESTKKCFTAHSLGRNVRILTVPPPQPQLVDPSAVPPPQSSQSGLKMVNFANATPTTTADKSKGKYPVSNHQVLQASSSASPLAASSKLNSSSLSANATLSNNNNNGNRSPIPQLPFTRSNIALIDPGHQLHHHHYYHHSSSSSMSSSLVNMPSHCMSMSESLAQFSHFDIQSTFFNSEYIKLVVMTLNSAQSLVNVKTGASAATASRQSSIESLSTNSTQSSVNTHPQTPSDRKSFDPDNAAFMILRSNNSNTFLNNDSSSQTILANSSSSNRCSTSSGTTSIGSGLSTGDLVEECACFRIEIGGDSFRGLGLVHDVSQRRIQKLNSISVLDKSFLTYYKREICELIDANHNEPFTIEYQDWGSYFYRFYLSNQEHANYVGCDKQMGPVAISVRRDKMTVEPLNKAHNIANSSAFNSASSNSVVTNVDTKIYDYAYRVVIRTSDLNVLRGTVLEEHVAAKSNVSVSSSKGLPHREIIGYLMPELDLNCLRLADSKIVDKLIDLDEQYLIKNHKIGVLLCKAGQSTEEEMYNNRDSTPAFDEFLQLLGDRVCLKGFHNYRGGLDNMNDTTGTHSVYTKFRNKEVMFHVSTMLPFSNNDRQQLTRKRHIGNDLVTIIFQEPGAPPFSPKSVRSQYQHIFIIVRVINPNSYNPQYSVAVSCSQDIPSFGPPLPKNPLFLKSKEFREFLLAKIINADSVGLKCEKFTQIRTRTRNGTLKDLVDQYSTKFTLETGANGLALNSGLNNLSQRLAMFNFNSIKQKKLRSKSLQAFNSSLLSGIMSPSEEQKLAASLFKLSGTILWELELVEDFYYSLRNCCRLGISRQNVVIVDMEQRCVLFSIGTNAVIGWTQYESDNGLILYFDVGECLYLKFKSRGSLIGVVKRLEFFTKGCRTIELSLEKRDYGQFGFNIHHDGVVTEVEPYNLAYMRGLRHGTRIVRIEDQYVINMNHQKMIDILRRAKSLKITFLLPFEDGSARRGQDESFSLYAYLSTCSSINERQVDNLISGGQPNTAPSYEDYVVLYKENGHNTSTNRYPGTPNFNRQHQTPSAHQPPAYSSPVSTSSQKHKRLNSASNIAKLINRLSTSGLTNTSVVDSPSPTDEEQRRQTLSTSSYHSIGKNNKSNMNYQTNVVNPHLYHLHHVNNSSHHDRNHSVSNCVNLCNTKSPVSANNGRRKSAKESSELQIPKNHRIIRMSNGNGTNADWAKLVQSTTKAFENAQLKYTDNFLNDSAYRPKLNSVAK